MPAIAEVVRNPAGAPRRGFAGAEGTATTILASAGSDVSLSLVQWQIAG